MDRNKIRYLTRGSQGVCSNSYPNWLLPEGNLWHFGANYFPVIFAFLSRAGVTAHLLIECMKSFLCLANHWFCPVLRPRLWSLALSDGILWSLGGNGENGICKFTSPEYQWDSSDSVQTWWGNTHKSNTSPGKQRYTGQPRINQLPRATRIQASSLMAID